MRTLLALSALAALAGCSTTPSGGDTGTVVDTTNHPPVADAGAAVTQPADLAVQLNGSGSSDPDAGDTLTYKWSFYVVPAGSELTTREKPFSDNNTATATAPTFNPDRVGTYVVQLVVNDGKVDSSPDNVVITITAPENLPVANAGKDISAEAGAVVTLDGSKSYDPQGRALTYAWTLVDKPTASALTGLTGADTSAPTFTPDARGNYTVNLVVSNGLASSVADAAVVTATGQDGAPTANAGPDQEVEDCTSVHLDCSGSVDPDGDKLTYKWAIQKQPTNSTASDKTSFSDVAAEKPTFWPDQAGTYILSCAVFDGQNWSSPDLVTLTAAERRSNSKPVADAGPDVSIAGGNAECTLSGYVYDCDECADQTVTLGASARASDPDGDPYTIKWTTTSANASIADPTSLTTSVTLKKAEATEPGTCDDTEYEFQLEVTDCTGDTTTDKISLNVSCCGVEDTGP
jgi:hypothetical protein